MNAAPPVLDCARCADLAVTEASRPLTPAEASSRAEHLATCDDCRREAAILGLARFDGSAPAAPALCDLGRRRALRAALAAADAEAPAETIAEAEAEPATAPARPRIPRRAWLAAGIAAAAVLLVGTVVTLRQGPPPTSSHLRDRAPLPEPTGGRVVLLSGDATLDGAAPRVGAPVRTGARAAVRSGRLGLTLPMGGTAILEAGAELAVTTLAEDRVALRLDQGEVLVSVSRRQAERVFAVDTAVGRFTVRGTVFSVRAGPGRASLQVLRGVVRVEAPGRPVRDVAAGQGLYLPDAGPATASPDDTGWRIRAERLVALIQGAVDVRGASLAVQSEPPGATVRIDETEIGVTPLQAELAPGRRELALAHPGFAGVRETVILDPAAPVTRRVRLEPLPVVTAAAPAPEPARAAPTLPARPARAEDPPRVADAPPEPVAPPTPPAETAATLLDRAQRLRAARDYPAAARAYQDLITRHAGSAEARAALVSLGLLLLGPGLDPAGALHAFDRYLAGAARGDLAEEACFGRARALRALGRRDAERTALADCLRRFPGAVEAMSAGTRLRELTPAREATP
jgi:ferric-dicitrate binding protein FerR (iron transport regulator)